MRPNVCMQHFHCLHDNSKNTGAISSNFLWALSGLLASMSLHLGSVALLGVEISSVRSLEAGGGDQCCSTSTLVFITFEDIYDVVDDDDDDARRQMPVYRVVIMLLTYLLIFIPL